MGLTRSSSGLVRYDAFGSDTSGSYDGTVDLSVSGGNLVLAGAGHAVYPTTAGVKCATTRSQATSGRISGGPVISANPSLDATADRDTYRLDYPAGSDWLLRRYINNSATTLATVATPDLSANDWSIARVYISGGTVYATFGLTDLSGSGSASDATYASGYGAVVHGGDANRNFDWVDFRIAHTITCTGMTEGHYLRVTDGTTAAEAAANGAGLATVDAGAVLFPLASVSIYTEAAGGGDLIAALDTGDYADMGGGDAFAYAAAPAATSNHGLMMMGCGQA